MSSRLEYFVFYRKFWAENEESMRLLDETLRLVIRFSRPITCHFQTARELGEKSRSQTVSEYSLFQTNEQ